MTRVTIVGGGLAGSEAAWQLAERGYDVVVHEMRPVVRTAAHQTESLAELVCSNTFKSTDTSNAHGLLKAEMRALGSLILWAPMRRACRAARRSPSIARCSRTRCRRGSLRTRASRSSAARSRHSVAERDRDRAAHLRRARRRAARRGSACGALAFYDAIAPVIAVESIDHEVVFNASRYGKGETSEERAEGRTSTARCLASSTRRSSTR